MMPESIKLALADDHPAFRKGLANMLRGLPEIKQVFEASNGRELLKLIETCRPELVLVDLQMPELDGYETIRAIREIEHDLPILILSMYDEEEVVRQTMQLGANGYLLKSADTDEIGKAIDALLHGYNYVPIPLSEIEEATGPEDAAIPAFTKRELEVIRLLCKRCTATQIAATLHLSEQTVECHQHNIFEKIGAQNIVGVIVFAAKHHLLRKSGPESN